MNTQVCSVRPSEPQQDGQIVHFALDWACVESVPATLPNEWQVRGGVLFEADDDVGTGVALSALRAARSPICHSERGSGNYGPTLRALCLDAHGVVSLREENLMGPRTVVIKRE
jgi:hypothetical protein